MGPLISASGCDWMALVRVSSWVMKLWISSAELWVQARGRWAGTGLRSATQTVCQNKWCQMMLKNLRGWKEHLCMCSVRTCQTLCCSPWKNWPLRVLAAALDKANHTTVSAPCSTLRSRSPIIWWNWGIDVETAGNRKKISQGQWCVWEILTWYRLIFLRLIDCYFFYSSKWNWFPLQTD